MVVISPSLTTRCLAGRSDLAKLTLSLAPLSVIFLPMSLEVQSDAPEPDLLPVDWVMGSMRGILMEMNVFEGGSDDGDVVESRD